MPDLLPEDAALLGERLEAYKAVFVNGMFILVGGGAVVSIIEAVAYGNSYEMILMKNIKIISYMLYVVQVIAINLSFGYWVDIFCIQLLLISMQEIFKYSGQNAKGERKRDILYESRKEYVDVLKGIVKDEMEDAGCIAINGEWGTGKSSIIDCLRQEVEEEEMGWCIYIKPTIVDEVPKLINEFELQLREKLRENGIYTGKNSYVQLYFKHFFEVLDISEKGKLLFADKQEEISYRNIKEGLQKEINQLVGNTAKKIVIIVEDFDRIGENYGKVFIDFLHEVLDFENCVTLIALDWNNIEKNKNLTKGYLEKYINKTIWLDQISFEEILRKNIHYWITEEEQKNENVQVDYVVHQIALLNKLFYEAFTQSEDVNLSEIVQREDRNKTNSRKIIRLLEDIRNQEKALNYRASILKQENIINAINITNLICYGSYVTVFYPETFRKIIALKGLKEYFESGEDKACEILEKVYRSYVLGQRVEGEEWETRHWSKQEIGEKERDLREKNLFTIFKALYISTGILDKELRLHTTSAQFIEAIENADLDKIHEYTVGYDAKLLAHVLMEKKNIKLVSKFISLLLRGSKVENLEDEDANYSFIYSAEHWDMIYVIKILQHMVSVNEQLNIEVYGECVSRLKHKIEALIEQGKSFNLQGMILGVEDENNENEGFSYSSIETDRLSNKFILHRNNRILVKQLVNELKLQDEDQYNYLPKIDNESITSMYQIINGEAKLKKLIDELNELKPYRSVLKENLRLLLNCYLDLCYIETHTESERTKKKESAQAIETEEELKDKIHYISSTLDKMVSKKEIVLVKPYIIIDEYKNVLRYIGTHAIESPEIRILFDRLEDSQLSQREFYGEDQVAYINCNTMYYKCKTRLKQK